MAKSKTAMLIDSVFLVIIKNKKLSNQPVINNHAATANKIFKRPFARLELGNFW
jgi:hypothetical protein